MFSAPKLSKTAVMIVKLFDLIFPQKRDKKIEQAVQQVVGRTLPLKTEKLATTPLETEKTMEGLDAAQRIIFLKAEEYKMIKQCKTEEECLADYGCTKEEKLFSIKDYINKRQIAYNNQHGWK